MSNDPSDSNNGGGYKKPPEKHQFKKGTSGNPSGRPKRKPAPHEIFLKRMYDEIAYSENGEHKKATQYELVLLSLIKKAMTGDLPSIKILLDMVDEAYREHEYHLEDPLTGIIGSFIGRPSIGEIERQANNLMQEKKSKAKKQPIGSSEEIDDIKDSFLEILSSEHGKLARTCNDLIAKNKKQEDEMTALKKFIGFKSCRDRVLKNR